MNTISSPNLPNPLKNAAGFSPADAGLVAEFLVALAGVQGASPRTMVAYRADLQHFTMFVTGKIGGGGHVAEPIAQQASAFLRYLQQQNYAVTSIKRKVSALRAFAKYLVGRGIVDVNFTAGLQTPRLARRPATLLDNGQIERLLAAPGGVENAFAARDTVILSLLCGTGIRGSELSRLRPENFDLSRAIVTVTRNGVGVEFAIRPQAVIACRRYLASHATLNTTTSGRFLLNRLGGDLSERAIRRILDRYAAIAQLGVTVNPNMCRRSFAAAQLAKGVCRAELRRVLGRKTLVATNSFSRDLKVGSHDQGFQSLSSLRARRAA